MRRNRPIIDGLVWLAVIISVCAFVGSASRNHIARQESVPEAASVDKNGPIVQKIDDLFADRWIAAGIQPAEKADDLTVLRRLSLVLHGTVPSIEEVRLFESLEPASRLDHWTERMLGDKRFSDYFARRLSRVFVGADDGQFVVFRRDRFWTWLASQLQSDRPYDQIVHDMISHRGLWTDKPEVNFIANAVTQGNVDHNKLAARTVRAFLGQRIDCAQCHNHPFAKWKQQEFAGLAACFQQVSVSAVGIEDNRSRQRRTMDQMSPTESFSEPAVPFHPEWLPDEGTARMRLADWVVHSENRRFDRAIVNRVWGLLFGRPWIQPVDDLPDPNEFSEVSDDLLDLLAEDFRIHGRHLKRLIGNITKARVFRESSQHAAYDSGERVEEIEALWAVFPVTRLRPEQVIGSMLQASSIKTIDQESHWTSRAMRFFQELDFVKQYGDLGDDEFTERSGTIPQALLRMNGKFAAEWTKSTPFSAAGRITGMAPDNDACLELCFLACLTRRPTDEERSTMRIALQQATKNERGQVVEDLYWSFFNGSEFCWEH